MTPETQAFHLERAKGTFDQWATFQGTVTEQMRQPTEHGKQIVAGGSYCLLDDGSLVAADFAQNDFRHYAGLPFLTFMTVRAAEQEPDAEVEDLLRKAHEYLALAANRRMEMLPDRSVRH